VPGYFKKDPNVHQPAEHLSWRSYERALEMAKVGCELAQPRAVEVARSAGLRLVFRSLDHTAPASIVSRGKRAVKRLAHGDNSSKER
jgi:aspartokinase